jgi:hypothetical protein
MSLSWVPAIKLSYVSTWPDYSSQIFNQTLCVVVKVFAAVINIYDCFNFRKGEYPEKEQILPEDCRVSSCL